MLGECIGLLPSVCGEQENAAGECSKQRLSMQPGGKQVPRGVLLHSSLPSSQAARTQPATTDRWRDCWGCSS